jgi:hypothetical protein
MDTTTADPLRRTRGSLAGATCPFLFPWLFTATGDFRADLRIMRAEAGIRHLAHVCLMH